MKLLFVAVAILAGLANYEAKKVCQQVPPRPSECPLCEVTASRDSSCACPTGFERRPVKVPCGPACTALGYCCVAAKCPACDSTTQPSAIASCTCDAPSTQIRRKYACGPACDALGYCCATPKCPACGSGTQPSATSDCVCDAPTYQRLVKYACGPACDALGYCCTS